MNKYITVVSFFFVFNVFFAQSDLDKFEGSEDVQSTLVNKKMFQMMANVKVSANDKETNQYLSLIKKLDNLKVYSTSNRKIAAEMKATVDQYQKTVGLEELKSTNSNANIKMWVKTKDSVAQMNEFLAYSERSLNGYEMVLMSLTGDFTLSEIAILIDKMKIPNGEELKKSISLN